MLLTQSSGTHCSFQYLASPITDSNDIAEVPTVSLNLRGLSYTRRCITRSTRSALVNRHIQGQWKGHDDRATAAAAAACAFLPPASELTVQKLLVVRGALTPPSKPFVGFDLLHFKYPSAKNDSKYQPIVAIERASMKAPPQDLKTVSPGTDFV